MKMVVNISFTQKIADEDIEGFRNASKEKIDEITAIYKSNVMDRVAIEFKGEEITIQTKFIDEEAG